MVAIPQKKDRAVPAADLGDLQNERVREACEAAERARFVSESMVPVFGRKAQRLSRAAERVQVVLGEYQDAMITRAVLGKAGEQAFGEGENAFVLGRMQAREAATAATLVANYVRLFGVRREWWGSGQHLGYPTQEESAWSEFTEHCVQAN